MTRDELAQWAQSRNTSLEIAGAIRGLARNDEEEAQRIWEEPSDEELISIWETVTKNGLNAATDFCWGAAGSDWYDLGA